MFAGVSYEKVDFTQSLRNRIGSRVIKLDPLSDDDAILLIRARIKDNQILSNDVIKKIFENYLQDGQLDDCDFSLKELRTIASSFLITLYTIYHPRMDYPGFDFEPKKKTGNKQKTDDTSHKPPEKIPDKSK